MGKMALTFYVGYSVVFTITIFHIGFGVFGRISPIVTVMMAIAVYGSRPGAWCKSA